MINNYISEIRGVDWVYEVISENFTNALDMMTDNSIVFGGAVRDCLARKKLLGDLDIIVPSVEAKYLIDSFSKSSKWVRITSDDTLSYKKQININSIHSFKGVDNKNIQLIIANGRSRDNFIDDRIEQIRSVDIVCCGVIMMNDGRVFEVIPNAYDDCLNNVLNLNKLSKKFDFDIIRTRIEKLTERGWKNNIDIEKVRKRLVLENRKNISKKDDSSFSLKSLAKRKNTNNELLYFYGPICNSEDLVVSCLVPSSLVKSISKVIDINECIKRIAKKFHMNIKVKLNHIDPILNYYFAVKDDDQASIVVSELERFANNGLPKVTKYDLESLGFITT
jgi:hypothetical protein